MDNTNDVIELLDILYGMVNEAWGVPPFSETKKFISGIKTNYKEFEIDPVVLKHSKKDEIKSADKKSENKQQNDVNQKALLLPKKEISSKDVNVADKTKEDSNKEVSNMTL